MKTISSFSAWLLIAALPLCFSTVHSQTTAPSPALSFSRQKAIGFSFGLKSVVGLDGAIRFTPKWAARVGLNLNKIEIDRPNSSILGSSNRYDIRFFERLSNIEALGEWSPGKRGKFRAVLGAACFFKNEIGGSGALANEAKLNDAEISAEEVGSAKLTVSWASPLSAYAGFAFGRLIPMKRLGFSFELGAWLKGKPRFDIEATSLLSENDRNEPYLERNFKNQVFYPNLSFRLAYRLSSKQI